MNAIDFILLSCSASVIRKFVFKVNSARGFLAYVRKLELKILE